MKLSERRKQINLLSMASRPSSLIHPRMKDDDSCLSPKFLPSPLAPLFSPFFSLPPPNLEFVSFRRKRTTYQPTTKRGGTLKQQITSSGSSIITRHLITADGCRVWAILRRLSRLTPAIDTILTRLLYTETSVFMCKYSGKRNK